MLIKKTSTPQATAILAKLVASYVPDLPLSIFEIGARPVQADPEPYAALVGIFDNLEITAFEIGDELCDELNRITPKNVTYHSCALGKETGKQTLYETQHPMCSSLYEPNDELMKKYFRLDMATSNLEHELEVTSLDDFTKKNSMGDIDFVKIDIQGAELDVFKGGEKALKNSLFIVTEVEFIPLYKDQPLFGEVSTYLQSKGLMFHKFAEFGGRCLKPLAIENNPHHISQLMWADAVFVKSLELYNDLDDNSLYKIALFAFMYGSPDLTYYCFNILDERNNSDLRTQFAQLGRN